MKISRPLPSSGLKPSVKLEEPPWRASRQRRVETKEEPQDNSYDMLWPSSKKKARHSPARDLKKSAKERLMEDLAATQFEEISAAQQKEKLLEELATKARKEKEAAERKRRMLEQLAEIEHCEAEQKERERRMEEERKRAKMRAAEVAAKVRERRLAEKLERDRRAAEAVQELTALEEEFDNMMTDEVVEQESDRELKQELADIENQVQEVAPWNRSNVEQSFAVQQWSQPLDADPSSDDKWIAEGLLEIERQVKQSGPRPVNNRAENGTINFLPHAVSVDVAPNRLDDSACCGVRYASNASPAYGAWADSWSQKEAVPVPASARTQGRVLTSNDIEYQDSAARWHDGQENVAKLQHPSSSSSAPSARSPAGTGFKGLVVAPPDVRQQGPRVVRPPAHRLALLDTQDRGSSRDAEPAQAPRVVAPRVASAQPFCLDFAAKPGNEVKVVLSDAIVPAQARPAPSEDDSMRSWRVVPSEASIRDSMDLRDSKVLGTKKKGECIKGRREGDWLVLLEGAGYILIQRGIVNLLEEIPNAYEWKADTKAFGTAEGNVVVAGVRYTGCVKQFGAGASFSFITSPEIREAFGKDVFITQRELENLIPGQQVSFRVEIHKGRPQAFDIEKLDNKDRGLGLKYKKTKLCDNWINGGICLSAGKCQYAHGEEDLGNDRPLLVNSKMKRPGQAPCFDFLSGYCERGDECRYRHVEKLPPGCNFQETGEYSRGDDYPFPNAPIEATSQEPCFKFAQGKCTRGDKCVFKHVVKCAEFQEKGFCVLGDDCPLQHGQVELKQAVICRDFKHGVCTRGDQCRFEHLAVEA